MAAASLHGRIHGVSWGIYPHNLGGANQAQSRAHKSQKKGKEHCPFP